MPSDTRWRSRSNLRILTSISSPTLNDLGRMLDALPRHIGDMQQAVDAAEIDECAVVGQVLDDTLDRIAFLQLFQQLLALGRVFLLDDGAA